MSQYKNLDTLFEKARSQRPLIDRNKAAMLIAQGTPVSKTNTIKSIAMKTLIVSIVVSAGFFAFFGTERQTKDTPYRAISSTETNIQAEEETFSVETEEQLQHTNVYQQVISKESRRQNDIVGNLSVVSAETKRIEYNTQIFLEQEMDKDISFVYDSTTNRQRIHYPLVSSEEDTEKPILDKSKTVMLTKDELAELGLFAKDSVLLFEKDQTEWGFVQAAFVINRGLTCTMSRTHTDKKENNNKGFNPVPYFASTPSGEYLFGLYAPDIGIKMEESEEKSPELLPVWVEMEQGKAGVIIVWFANDSNTLRLLPQRITEDLEKNPNAYSNRVKFYRDDSKQKLPLLNLLAEPVVFDSAQIVEPDNSLKGKLGFRKTRKEGVFNYKRKRGGYILHVHNKRGMVNSTRTGCTDNVNENNIKKVLPLYITPTSIISKYNVNFIGFKCVNNEEDALQKFLIDLPKMFAIKIKHGNKGDYRLFWYPYSEALMKELSIEDRSRVEAYIHSNKNKVSDNVIVNVSKKESLNYAQIAGVAPYDTTKIKGLSLTAQQLEKLGISVVDKEIRHATPHIKNGVRSTIVWGIGKEGTSIRTEEGVNTDTAHFVYPALITDDLGHMRMGFDGKSITNVNLSSLIPIAVKSGDVYSTLDKVYNRHRPDLVFWFEPTDKFLDLLDPQTAKEIQSDIEAILCTRSKSVLSPTDTACNEEKEVSCKYFEACDNSIQKAISGYRIYPNPASESITVRLELTQNCNVQVNVFTLNGVLVARHDYPEQEKGLTENKMELAQLPAGMYLVRISTDKGDVFSERVIVLH